ncbi:lipase maturation factor family protein [Microbacterium sp. SD291]|uniref:lipase maturation factor family protein n=1 Tax=Microbacterium sp. SD291 TaxID=2782007 RepID=UPI001A95FB03|nr:lipase maturation factor family protein [Microbacterium sp. SD291]MBO0981177.1 lipase maturation factor family protein [Microbacterium sp. SD291]
MDGFAAVDFGFAREALQRGIAALYLVAFVSTLNQFRPLLGERGLLPAPALLDWVAARDSRKRMLNPTLFRRFRYTDRRLVVLCGAGIAIAAALVAGIPQLAPPWVPMLCFLALWGGYLSVVSIGQTFYSFGWEMLLIECGFLAAFLGSNDQPPSTVVIVLFWWLLFRLEFGAGMIKIRGGREWRDLTALTYHHETQPMPGPLSRQAHLLPRWFHKGEVLGNHFAQLVVPIFLFAPLLSGVPEPVEGWVPGPVPQIIGAVAACVVIATQAWLVLTGNFAWLNWATIVIGFSAIGLPGVGAQAGTAWAPEPVEGWPWVIDGIPLYWFAITCAVGILYVIVSPPALRNLFARRQLMNASFNRWQLANAYGAFGTVTKERVEIVVEGAADEEGSNWREYEFKGKPGDVRRIPRQFAPYHLRLDWLMWFLPLGRSLDDWFTAFLIRLLEADAPTLALLRVDPFDGERPRWVRAVTYRYRFATRAERRDHGVRWVRTRKRVIMGPVGLR